PQAGATPGARHRPHSPTAFRCVTGQKSGVAKSAATTAYGPHPMGYRPALASKGRQSDRGDPATGNSAKVCLTGSCEKPALPERRDQYATPITDAPPAPPV